jgi:hypothetical protein
MKQRHQSHNVINCCENENNLFLCEVWYRISHEIFVVTTTPGVMTQRLVTVSLHPERWQC